MTEKELKRLIGRLIMPRLMIDEFTANQKYRIEIEHLVRVGKAGGFCIFGGTPNTVAETIASLQEIAKEYYELPLLFSCDAEWGTSMRLREGGTEFPHARAFAKAKDATLVEEASYRIAMELRALGIWWHFAPVVDVNTNPENPIINIRSYGETAEPVIRTASIVFRGIRRANISACAKHFPGHGDTFVDSHQALPVITHGAQWMFSNDLMPFEAMIREGIPSIMTGHIAAPSLAARYGASERERQLPATVSRALTQELLRKNMKFDGVIVTDSLEMGGIKQISDSSGDVAVMALGAGVDVLLMPTDTIETHQAVWRALDMKELGYDAVEQSVSRVHKLISDSMLGDTPTIEETFERSRTRALALKIAEKAIKIRGDIGALKDATEILLLCSDGADTAKAQACKAEWIDLGIRIPIHIVHGNSRREYSDNPIVISYSRPHGVLGSRANHIPVESVIDEVAFQIMDSGVAIAGIILLGDPYLEELFKPLDPPCTILSYSATEPSIKVVGNLLKNAL